MPIYKLEDLKFLLQEDAWDFATSRARDHAEELGLDKAGVARVLMLLSEDDFRKTINGCETNGYGTVDADDYLLWCSPNPVDEPAFRCRFGYGIEMYIKLAIDFGNDGDACLVVSFHPSGVI